ncbi:MAG: hypothetical protein WC700_17495 [Gemmatimonadaceae bacterium]|jgi:hypothetical protein
MALSDLLGRLAAGLNGARMLADALGIKAEHVAPIAGAGRVAPAKQIQGAKLSNHMVNNIDERVALIVGLVQRGATDMDVIAKAREIVSQRCGDQWCTRPRDWKAEITAIHNAVRDKLMRYVRDPDGVDLFAHPKHSLKMKAGDCDEQCSLEGALLRAIGYPVELVVVETVNAPVKGEMEHIFLVTAYEDSAGKQHAIWLDPTVDKPAGWRVPEGLVVNERSFSVP